LSLLKSFYVTDPYRGYSAVLVRLSRVSPDVLRDLLGMAYKFVMSNEAPRSRSRNRELFVIRGHSDPGMESEAI
jgi:hypothetical protein